MARLLVDQLRDYASRLIVDNKPGAAGRIALESVKASTPDGTTLILTPASMMVLNPHVVKALTYDPIADFAPISTVCRVASVLVIGPKVPVGVKTIRDLVQWCKANPKEANYGTSAAGSVPHFAADMLFRAAGVEATHVAYKGGAPVIQDAVGGHLPIAMPLVSGALPHLQSGRLRALAVPSRERLPFLPDVPTFIEAGFKDLVADEWFGVFAPARTPPKKIAELNTAIQAAVKTKEFADGLAKSAYTPVSSSAVEFATSVKGGYRALEPDREGIRFQARRMKLRVPFARAVRKVRQPNA